MMVMDSDDRHRLASIKHANWGVCNWGLYRLRRGQIQREDRVIQNE